MFRLFFVEDVTVLMLEERLFKVSSKLARANPITLSEPTVLMSFSSSRILASVEVLTASASVLTASKDDCAVVVPVVTDPTYVC